MKMFFAFLLFTLLTIGTLFYAPLRQSIDYPEAIHWHLPTFLHVVFLSWVTVLWGGMRGRWQVPLFWSLVNIAFEGIQFWLRPNYGTFDPMDVLAAVLGGLVAYLGMSMFNPSGYRRLASLAVGIYGCLILTATQSAKKAPNTTPELTAEAQFEQADIPGAQPYAKFQERNFDQASKLALFENTLVSVTPEGQVNVWDVTSKDRLESLGNCVCFGPTEDIVAKDGILAALGPADSGVGLIDLSLPATPVLISQIPGEYSGMNLDDGLLFLVSDQQLFLYDLVVKEEPALVSTYNSDMRLLGAALAFETPHLYVGAEHPDGFSQFHILSLDDQHVFSLEARDWGTPDLGSLSLDGHLLFLNRVDASMSVVFDVSDLGYPRQLNTLHRAEGGLPLFARDGMVFLPNERSFWIAEYKAYNSRARSSVELSPRLRFEPDQKILDFAVGEDHVYLLLKEDEIARSLVVLAIDQGL